MAENKVKHPYWSSDLKLHLPASFNGTDPGIGGASKAHPNYNATKDYENFLARMTAK
jgi:hypothetical protein